MDSAAALVGRDPCGALKRGRAFTAGQRPLFATSFDGTNGRLGSKAAFRMRLLAAGSGRY